MLTPYRRILAHPGAIAFSVAGLAGRLPISTVSLGIVLLVSGRTGSYADAGLVAAAGIVAAAIASPLQGRLLDRYGQARVLPLLALGLLLGVVLVVVAVQASWAAPLPHACAALAGAATPQVGSAVRARWRHLLDEPAELDTAFALEAVLDETVFVVGPVLVTVLATTVSPWAGLVTAATVGAVGTLLLAVQHRTEPPATRTTDTVVDTTALPWAGLLPLVAVGAGLGGIFGATEVVAVAYAEQEGRPAAAGVMLAAWAAGSLLAGAYIGTRTLRSHPLTRLRISALALTVAMAGVAVLPGLVAVTAALLLAGVAISPTLISAVSLVERTVPRRRLTEGMAWLSTGIAAGIAPGAALAGVVVDEAGARTAFVVPVAAGLLAVAAAWCARRPEPVGSGTAPTHR